jgi:D-glycero-D-manno-heptose 1,7-bisphosphate phosphatase
VAEFSSTCQRPVVFLDRDGTLNVEKGYINHVNDLVLIEGAARAVAKLNQAGIAAILTTNQSGAARRFYPLSHIDALHARLIALLKEEGAHLDALYVCTHLPEGTEPALAIHCHCRKPSPGMVELAFKEHLDLDRHQAFVVGDKTADLGLANNAGIKSILVETGYGRSLIDAGEDKNFKVDCRAKSIVEAVDWILETTRKANARTQ